MTTENKQTNNQKYYDKHSSAIESYKNQLSCLKDSCLGLSTESELTDLFKGVVIMFIKDVILLYNKLIQKIPDLRYSKSSEKITNLNVLLNALETDGKLFNLDCTDILLRAYVTYFYAKYRDDMVNWDIEKIKSIDETKITEAVVDTATKENVLDRTSEHLDIVPEIILMLNNLKDRDILKLLYLLNNLNTVIDVYLYKKMSA
jgi:hypothetical protein